MITTMIRRPFLSSYVFKASSLLEFKSAQLKGGEVSTFTLTLLQYFLLAQRLIILINHVRTYYHED